MPREHFLQATMSVTKGTSHPLQGTDFFLQRFSWIQLVSVTLSIISSFEQWKHNYTNTKFSKDSVQHGNKLIQNSINIAIHYKDQILQKPNLVILKVGPAVKILTNLKHRVCFPWKVACIRRSTTLGSCQCHHRTKLDNHLGHKYETSDNSSTTTESQVP